MVTREKDLLMICDFNFSRVVKRFMAGIIAPLLILFLLFTPSQFAQKPDIKLSLEPEKREYQIGDRIVLKFLLEYPGEWKVIEPAAFDSIGKAGLEYLTTDTLQNIEKEGRIVKHFNWAFSGFDSLDVKVPALEWRFVKGTDTLVQKTGPFEIKIRPIPVDTTKEISDVKPPERIPWGWEEYAILFGGLLIVALLAWLIYRRFKKKPVEEVKEPEPVKILTNFDKALEKLEEIDRKGYLAEGKYKEHFSEVSDTIRWYFEIEYRFPSLELTTRETIRELTKKGFPQEVVAGADDFLTRADMVKFAKYEPAEVEQANYTASAAALLGSCDKRSANV